MTTVQLKTIGYMVSNASVILLAVVTWQSAVGKPALMACLIAGVAAAILGMCIRWLCYWKDKAVVHRPPHVREEGDNRGDEPRWAQN